MSTPMKPFVQPPSRRALLGGAAVALSLPFLESFGWRRTARAATCPAGAPRRLLVYHVPNGVYMNSWMPKGTGTTWTPSPILQGLTPVRDDVLVVTGLVNGVGCPAPDRGGAHAFGSAALLTCVQVQKTSGPFTLAPSIDQVLAGAIGSCTRLPSLELGMDTTEGAQEGATIPVVWNRNISWSGPSTPVPRIVDPQAAFDRLFAGVDATASAADAARRRVLRTSVMDAVVADARRLSLRLGDSDRKKVDEYTTSIRDVETRVQAQPADAARACASGTRPPATTNRDFVARLELMHDLMILALQCDATRVITFSMGNALSTRPYTHLGIGDGHFVTHHGGDPKLYDQQITIDKWRIDELTKLIMRLKAIQDADGTSLLRNMALYYTSEISDGDKHSQHNKPVLIAGQLGGAITTGRLLQASTPNAGWTDANAAFKTCDEGGKAGCTTDTQLANLYVTFMNAMGVPAQKFGNSTGALPLA